jgi:galactose mutarotase-like enzyme
MFYTIENDNLKATFSSKGAEIQSLITKSNNREYIWCANPEIWEDHGPTLFPMIARLKDGEYSYDGQIYKMPMHGFAKDMEMEVIAQKADSITFNLKASEDTLKMYPFNFEFTVCYTLDGKTLRKEHTITNHDEKTMYYEVGGHDGYNICMEDGETMGDYYIDFGDLDALQVMCLDENIMFLKEYKVLPLEDGKLSLAMETFKDEALVYRGIPVHSITMKSKKSDYSIKFDYEGFNTLAIWTRYLPYESNYVCLEPWSSLPDCAYLGKEIEEKVDVRLLESGKSEVLTFAVTID